METQTRRTGEGAGLLGLGSVLVDSLPATLMTAEAPDRYTVEAVFTRRPENDEVAEILGPDTRSALARAGYPLVEVTVSDRRLEIAHTNLEELRDGLAGVLADRLAEISTGVHDRQEAAAVRFQDAAEQERHRAAAVAALAGSVTFRAGQDRPGERGSADDADDRAQIANWTDEGGRGR